MPVVVKSKNPKQNGKPKEKEEDEAYVAKSKAKKEKDPNAIKRPTSAYFLFMNDRRGTIKKENPTASMTDMTKIMTEEWKNLSNT